MTDEVNCLLADAYAFFQQGLYFDEDGNKPTALEMYEKGLTLVAQADEIKVNNACEFRNELNKIKDQVVQRVTELKSKDFADNQKIGKIRESLKKTCLNDADLVYWLPDGVQLVVIDKDKNSVFAPSPPSALAILKIEKIKSKTASSSSSDTIEEQPRAIIQVGPWAYPLCPNRTTILKNELGVYVVPNPTFNSPNMFVGIILPHHFDPQLEEEFMYALKQYATLKTSEVVGKMSNEQRARASERIANFLIKGGDVFAKTVTHGASKTGEFISEHGQKYRASIPKREGMPVNINPVIRHSVFILHKGSKIVTKVTKVLLTKIGEVGEAIGRQVAGSVSDETASGRLVQGTITVLGGGITGVSTAWISLEDASKTLFHSFANETVQTVQVKYGDEASETTRHALFAAGHTTIATLQLWELGPRSVAGHMARKAGIQFVRNYGSSSSNTEVKSDVQSSPALPLSLKTLTEKHIAAKDQICFKPKQL